MEGTPVSVTQLKRRLRGGSQPILAEASDGLQYVVKFNNNPQGQNVALNESCGAEIYSACGLSVPPWRPLRVTDAFINNHPDCWMESENGKQRPMAGYCFASLFLGTYGAQLFEILPEPRYAHIHNRSSFWLSWLLDVCAEHTDTRQAVFIRDEDGWYEAFFVDHGHLFGGPKGDMQTGLVASRYLDRRIYPKLNFQECLQMQQILLDLDVDRIWRKVRSLPDEWKTLSGIERIARTLERLSDLKLVHTIADSLFEVNRRIDCRGPRDLFAIRALQGSVNEVLCSGVQTPIQTKKRREFCAESCSVRLGH